MRSRGLIAGNGSIALHQNGSRHTQRLNGNGTKVEKNVRMDYAEIKALYKVLRSNNKPCSCSETSSVFIYIDVRSTTIRWRRSKAAS